MDNTHGNVEDLHKAIFNLFSAVYHKGENCMRAYLHVRVYIEVIWRFRYKIWENIVFAFSQCVYAWRAYARRA